MKILSITAQKPHSTGSGVYLTGLVKGFAALGHEQAVVAGVYEEDEMHFPEGSIRYITKQKACPFPSRVCRMRCLMRAPYTAG